MCTFLSLVLLLCPMSLFSRMSSTTSLVTLHISDPPKALQHCKAHHFSDDTNFFHTSKSAKNAVPIKFHHIQKNELVIPKPLKKIL